jgi:flagella basal body P-ring formation protein FlgA
MKMLLLILSLFVNNNSLDKQIKNYLDKYLVGYLKYEYEILSSPKSLHNFELLSEKEFSMRKNIIYIPVKIDDPKNESKSFISVKVKLYKSVLVALQTIKAKTDLTELMFETRTVDVTTLKGVPVGNMGIVNSMRSKSHISTGEVLTEEEIENIPVIFSGDEVKAEKNIGAVSINICAFAREDGNIGDNIKIRTVDNKQFIARVIGQKKVLIEE